MRKVSTRASRAEVSSKSRADEKSSKVLNTRSSIHNPRSPRSRTVAAKLAKLGIRREFDLVLHLPLRYEDETRVTPIANAPPGQPVQVEGTVRSTEVVYRPRRQLVSRIEDATGELSLRFFNFYGSQAKALEPGASVRAFGEVRTGFFGGEMIHPRFRVLHGETPLPTALTPIYPTTSGLAQAALRRLIEGALARAQLDDTLPDEVSKRLGLCGFHEAVDTLHHPRPGADEEALSGRTLPAWRRMKFDELLAQQLSMRKHYRERKARRAPVLEAPVEKARRHTSTLIGRLPFQLTRRSSEPGERSSAISRRPTRCIDCCRAMSAAARR